MNDLNRLKVNFTHDLERVLQHNIMQQCLTWVMSIKPMQIPNFIIKLNVAVYWWNLGQIPRRWKHDIWVVYNRRKGGSHFSLVDSCMKLVGKGENEKVMVWTCDHVVQMPISFPYHAGPFQCHSIAHSHSRGYLLGPTSWGFSNFAWELSTHRPLQVHLTFNRWG